MALSTAAINALDLALRGVGNAEEVVVQLNRTASLTGNLPDLSGVTATSTELNKLAGVTAGTNTASKGLVVGASKQLDTLAVATPIVGADATPGAATQSLRVIAKKTTITSGAATSIFTVTCPNATHTAVVRITAIASVNNSGALDSSRAIDALIAFDRISGAALVGVAGAKIGEPAVATSGTATLTTAISVAAVGGSVGATNTMDIQVTLTKTGGTDCQIVALAELINSEASGMTIVAA